MVKKRKLKLRKDEEQYLIEGHEICNDPEGGRCEICKHLLAFHTKVDGEKCFCEVRNWMPSKDTWKECQCAYKL